LSVAQIFDRRARQFARPPHARPTVAPSLAGRATTSKHHLIDGEVNGMVPAAGNATVTPRVHLSVT
jgi:hypothetical protein